MSDKYNILYSLDAFFRYYMGFGLSHWEVQAAEGGGGEAKQETWVPVLVLYRLTLQINQMLSCERC